MANIPDIPHPLQRDGRSQPERVVKALAPPASVEEALRNGSAMVDEHALADLLDFILRFARQVRFQPFNPGTANRQTRLGSNGISNGLAGHSNGLEEEDLPIQSDWAALFRQSPLFIIAAISKTDTQAIRDQFDEHAADAGRFEQFEGVHLLFDLCISLLFQIHQWGVTLKQESEAFSEEPAGALNGNTSEQKNAPFRPFGDSIRDIISTNLASTAKRLLGYAWAAQDVWAYHPYRSFSDLVQLKAWNITDKDMFQRNTTLTIVKGSQRTRVKHAVQELSLIFSELFGGMKEIVSRAEAALHETIQSKNAHPPHLGLLIAFIRLLEKARTNPGDDTKSYLNAATQKHLDFFYKQVLQLKLKDAEPDHTHLVFEPAKQLDAVKLDKDTAFLGGKDPNGIPIVFKLDDEVVVTKAQVGELRTLYLKQIQHQPSISPAHPSVYETLQDVYFAPVANSADGLGEAFPKNTLAAWKTLGWDKGKLPVVGSENSLMKQFQPNAKARLGLMVASKALHLEGGQRTITFTMDCEMPIDAPGDVKTDFTAYYEAFKKALNTRFEITEDIVKEIKQEGMVLLADYLRTEFILPYSPPNFSEFLNDLDSSNLPHDTQNEKNQIEAYKLILTRLVNRHHGFDVMLSGEKEWLRPYNVTITSDATIVQSKFKIFITIELDPDFPAVTWYDPEILGEQIDARVPAIRLELRQEQKVTDDISLYHFFRYLRGKNVAINTNVTGFQAFLLQTDEGVQDAKKAFTAFGVLPKIGSSFFIGSNEIFRKRWDDVTLNLTWKDKPLNIREHYYNYEKDGISDDAFKVNAKALLQRKWLNLDPVLESSPPPLNMFDAGSSASTWKFKNITANFPSEDPNPVEPLTVFSNEGFVRFSLEGETFRHDSFAEVFARQARAQALLKLSTPEYVTNAIYKEPKANAPETYDYKIFPADYDNDLVKHPSSAATVELPKSPYTPVIESISLDYGAHTEIGDLHIYHLHPFAGAFRKEDFFDEKHPVSILPRFEDEGTLFLGLSDLTPGENLDLLFQVAESTADPDLQPADVQWFYLSKNDWKPLEKDVDILSDETEGFLRSGVIKIAVPPDINRENTVLPAHLHWLKASAHQRAGAVSETIGVHTQAARATFAPEKGSFTDRLATPLPAGTISKPLVENAGIKKTSQPYPTFGGLPAEPEPDFYRRVSEHLRHKGRAITLFDYERLVLEYFPQVFKVKCINHSLGLPEEARDFHVAPGHVIVAVIPDLSKLELSDRFRPKATRSLLDEIEDFLKQRTSPFARVRVLNPRYQPFRVTGSVRFIKGKSADFYKKQLQKDLDRFLAPWAFGETDKIDFGGVVYKSVILKYIESLAYVDYVTNFLLLRKKETVLPESVAPQTEIQHNVSLNLKKEGGIRQGLNPAITERVKIGGLSFSALEIDSIFNRSSSTQLIASAKVLVEDYIPVDEIPADTARSILVAEEHVFEALGDECCKPNGNARNDDCMKGLGFETIREGKPCPEKAILPAPPHS